MRANALLAAPLRRPRMPTAAPNIRTPDVRSNLLPWDAAAVPHGGHGSSHEPASERHGRSNGSGGAAAETKASASTMLVVTAASVNWAMAANRERKQVSAFACVPMAPRAEMHTCGRAGAGAPLHASSLMPWKMATHRSRWAPSPRRGGAGLEEATIASSVANERMAQSGGLRSKTVARTFFDRPVQADEADAARCEHHEAMRNVRGAPRVIGRTHLSGWLFECSWRRLQTVLVLVAT